MTGPDVWYHTFSFTCHALLRCSAAKKPKHQFHSTAIWTAHPLLHWPALHCRERSKESTLHLLNWLLRAVDFSLGGKKILQCTVTFAPVDFGYYWQVRYRLVLLPYMMTCSIPGGSSWSLCVEFVCWTLCLRCLWFDTSLSSHSPITPRLTSYMKFSIGVTVS